jgi:hypothetical protein
VRTRAAALLTRMTSGRIMFERILPKLLKGSKIFRRKKLPHRAAVIRMREIP